MNINERVEKIEKELVELRRHFHKHPERSWHEFETVTSIRKYLEELGIDCYDSEHAKTGLIAVIKPNREAKAVIGIRADMDGLPVQELNELEYKSQNDGTMHACGHDVHITVVLGAAKILAGMIDELAVEVRLIFQPAEEFIEDSGAYYMSQDSLVKTCDRIIGLHVWAKIECGYASLRYGAMMSAADTFDIHVEGIGGHGALPYQCVDPIVAASEFVLSLQRAVAREINALEPAVISITAFNAGTTFNIIPKEAHLMGTARTFSPELRAQYPALLERIAKGVGEATRTNITVDYHMGTPPTINDKEVVDTGLKAANKVFGEDKVIPYEVQMGGEDFAKYTRPKCFLLLGGGFEEEERRFPQHSPYLDVDEKCLKLGVAYFVQYVLDYDAEQV